MGQPSLSINPSSVLPVVPYFGRIMVFALIALALTAACYSKEELSGKAWWGRTVLHLLLLEAVLLPLAHHWGFWSGGRDIVIYAGFILLAKVVWHLADYGLDAKTAEQINETIRKNRLENRKEED